MNYTLLKYSLFPINLKKYKFINITTFILYYFKYKIINSIT